MSFNFSIFEHIPSTGGPVLDFPKIFFGNFRPCESYAYFDRSLANLFCCRGKSNVRDGKGPSPKLGPLIHFCDGLCLNGFVNLYKSLCTKYEKKKLHKKKKKIKKKRIKNLVSRVHCINDFFFLVSKNNVHLFCLSSPNTYLPNATFLFVSLTSLFFNVDATPIATVCRIIAFPISSCCNLETSL